MTEIPSMSREKVLSEPWIDPVTVPVYFNEELDLPAESELNDPSPVQLSQEQEQWIKIIQLVTDSGVWNKDLCCIMVSDHCDVILLQDLLINYHDKQIVEFLQYGWLVEQSAEVPLEIGGTESLQHN